MPIIMLLYVGCCRICLQFMQVRLHRIVGSSNEVNFHLVTETKHEGMDKFQCSMLIPHHLSFYHLAHLIFYLFMHF